MSSGTHTNKKTGGFGKKAALILLLVVLLAVLAFIVDKLRTAQPAEFHPGVTIPPATTFTPTVPPTADPTAAPTETPVETPEIIVTPKPIPEFHPYHTEETDPDKFVNNLGINVKGTTLKSDEVYAPEEEIDFLDGDRYFKTARPGHNLDRARTQIALARSLEKLAK